MVPRARCVQYCSRMNSQSRSRVYFAEPPSLARADANFSGAFFPSRFLRRFSAHCYDDGCIVCIRSLAVLHCPTGRKMPYGCRS